MSNFIRVKTGSSTWSAATAATKGYIKKASGWVPAKFIWMKFLTGWVRIWPTSGIFETREPFIQYFASDTYANRMPNSTYPAIRIGDSYFGKNAIWDLNGWTASSYTFRWKLYDENGDSLGITLRSGTTWNSQPPTSGGNGQDQLESSIWTASNSTNADRNFLGLEVEVSGPSNSIYNGLSVSTKIKVVREKPIISTEPALSNMSPNVGSIINYSSGWNTAQAYKPEAARTTIKWYRSTSNGLTASQLKALTPIQTSGYSYTAVSADNSNYIYAMEEVFNSGTDFESLIDGVTAVVKTTSVVATAPNAFTYSLENISSVTTPSAPVQQRVSTTSNTVLVEMSSSFPSDTESYNLRTYGTGSSTGATINNPATSVITTLNQYNSSGNFVPTGGSFDIITNIISSASNSPINTFTEAIGTSRTLRFNVSATTGAQSWKVNYTVSGATSGNGTFALNTNSMPATISLSGNANPTVTITGVIAYTSLNQLGGTTTGTAGSTTSLPSIAKPTAQSTITSANYTFYTDRQITGSQRRVTLPAAFNSGTTIYVSTNGYINWGGSGLGADPAGSISIPALDSSGITIAPLAGDLRQGAVSASGTTSTGGLWTFADSTNYWVTWWGNYYNDAAQVARYQVKFYWGQSYADVYIVNNSLTTITPSTTAVQNNLNEYQNWSATTSQTSTLLSTASMNRVSTQDGVDDNRTAIVATAPQPPSGGSASVDPTTGTAGLTTYTASTSGWSGTPTISYSYAWQGLNKFGFYWETFSTATTFVPTVAQNSNSLSWQLVVTASNGISPDGVATKSFTVNAPVIPTITIAANSGVSQTAGTINWTSTNQASFSSTGTFSGTGTTGTSISKTGLTAGTIYTGTITVTSSTGNTASANYSLTTSAASVIPTITMGANSGVSSTGGTINWTSTNQASFSSTGTFSGTGTTGTSISKTGLTANTTYTGTVTVTSSTNDTAQANYSLTTSATPTWTITWDANGGNGGGTTTQNQGVAHTAPSPGTRDGFDFVYYRYPTTGGPNSEFVSSGGTYNPTGNMTWAAIWTAKTYAVTYNANNGTGAPSAQTKTHGTNLTLSSTTPTRSGFTFAGWNTAANGTGSAFAAGGVYTVNAALSLFAQWTANPTSYTVSYSANGGGGATVPANQVTTGTITVATRPNFTRTNCTLGAGWNTAADGTGTNIASGASFTPSADTILYARWTAVANSATAPSGFAFDGNNLPSTGRKRWSWTGTGTVTGGTRTGFRVEISSTSASGPFTTATGSPLATTARSYDIAVSPVTSSRWVRIASEYTDGLGVSRVGTFTAAL